VTAQLLVETVDLRRALKAVAPFVDRDADLTNGRARIRVTADQVITYVQATNGAVGALAIVSTLTLTVDGEVTDDPLAFDLSPADAAKILTCFPGRDGKDGEPGDEIRLDVDAEHLTITDASGLFEGQSLVLGRVPDVEHPAEIIKTFTQLVHEHPQAPHNGVLATFGPSLALLIGASKVYDKNILLEMHQRGERVVTLARIGESFLAVVTEAYVDQDQQASYKEYRDAWTERLDDPEAGDESGLARLSGVLGHDPAGDR
jgi:hypothetical protein